MELALTLAAGAHDRWICPVHARVPEINPGMPARLYELESEREVPCQASPGAVAWLVAELSKGTVRRYRLVLGGEETNSIDSFGLRDKTDEALEFTVGGKLFTRYHYAATRARPYFHPVIGPSGKRVTRSYPMELIEGETRDHP